MEDGETVVLIHAEIAWMAAVIKWVGTAVEAACMDTRILVTVIEVNKSTWMYR